MSSVGPPADHVRRHRGFTVLELLVLVGIVVILLSIFIPYLLKMRESDQRARCTENLRQLREAFRAYASDNGSDFPRVVYDAAANPNGYAAYTGPDDPNPFAPDSQVLPNDVTASLWLLVRGGIVTDTARFICPSSGDLRDPLTNPTGNPVNPGHRGNFRGGAHLSYSYSSPFSSTPGYLMNDTLPSDFAVMADKSPAGTITAIKHNAPPLELAKVNSTNHDRAGQNVLYADGHIDFMRTPFCGVEKDNIYTALAPQTLEPGDSPPAYGSGYWGHDTGPSWPFDSYLVPVAADNSATFSRRPAPATTQSSTTTSTTTPAP